MCCREFRWLYRHLPYLHALTGFLEMILGIIRLAIFFSPLSTPTGTKPKQYTGKYVAAFIIDWISSIIPTAIGLFTIIIILVILFKLCVFCLNAYNRHKGSTDDINTSGVLRKIVRSKSIRRCFILDCNCPVYKARPAFRFQIRFLILCVFFVLRITAIGLYATAPDGDNDGGLLAGLCALSLIFLFNTLGLDLYRYCVWWHYTPDGDPWCCGRSKKHERYLPYHMVGDFRDPRTLGDQPCREKPCHNRKLDHIAVFHGNDYQPQDRWRDIPKPPLIVYSEEERSGCFKSKEPDNQPHYIGFHTTDHKAAMSIARSEFRPGKNGWLGPGVYFARSVKGTIGKAKSEGGGYIIAEIRMGKVYEVEREVITRSHDKFNKQIYDFVHHGAWQNEYDTCYMIHQADYRDEFAIRDAASQIVKWVIVIEQPFDPKVEAYGLDTEFDTTRCGCI